MPEARRGDRHIAVVDPGVNVPELDCFNRIARLSSLPVSYHLPALHGLDSLKLAEDGLAAIVILGSGASVNDRLAWQEPLNEWLWPRMQRLPTLGLCYGHQLIAHLFGGKVGFMYPDQKKLLGFRDVTLKETQVFGAARTGPLTVSHKEAVLVCPKDFEIFAASEACNVDGIAHRTLPIFGFQPHPEATRGFLNNAGITHDSYEPPAFAFGHGLVKGFLDFVASRVGHVSGPQ